MPPRRRSPATLWLLLIALGAFLLPDDMQAAVRLAVGDLVKPGRLIWSAASRRATHFFAARQPPPGAAASDDERLREELAAATRKIHALEIQLARHQEEAAARQLPIFAGETRAHSERLAQPVLIDAAVLGDAHAHAWRKGRWLDRGKSSGMLEEAPIITAARPLVDLGRDAQLSPEDPLLLGRTVIGKVHRVGRWTSTFLLVTDADFRGRAQLVRETPDGYVFGAKGVLRGRGEKTCLLEGIPATEAVEPGDLVYTAERDGLMPSPLCYGRVLEANLDEPSREWKIVVEPADRPSDLTTVQVLRTALNPRRPLAN